jgi:hypothetical protein
MTGHAGSRLVPADGVERIGLSRPAAEGLIWDNLPAHTSTTMRAFTARQPDWLTVIQTPRLRPGTERIPVILRVWSRYPCSSIGGGRVS